MLKNFSTKMLPFALIAAIGLSGCATNKTTPVVSVPTTTTLTTTQTTVNNVIAATKAACGFIPASLDVATLLSSNTGLQSASSVVSAICNSINKSSAKHKRASHRFGDSQHVVTLVDGIIIRGTLIK